MDHINRIRPDDFQLYDIRTFENSTSKKLITV